MAGENMCLEEARIMVHELGHDFEYNNLYKSGVSDIWDKIARTFYCEVSSSFFEYAFINYLIDNRVYYDDAIKLKRIYLDNIYERLRNILIILVNLRYVLIMNLK